MPTASSTEQPISRHRAYYIANRDKRRAYKKSYYAKNRDTLAAKNLAWKKQNIEKTREYVRASTIKGRYGLTREQYQAMFESQNHCCAICNVSQDELPRKLCVDHDHNTGKVRSLICHHCNGVLGHARDNTKILKSAIAYLEGHRT